MKRRIETWTLLIGLAAMMAAAAPGVLGATKDIRNIDIIVRKHPSGSASFVRADESGRIRFSLTEAGTYEIQGVARGGAAGPLFGGVFRLDGAFAPRVFRPGPVARGARLDGNQLLMAGADKPGGVLFTTTVEVGAAAEFNGMLRSDDEVRVDRRHLVFYGIAGGPQPAAQRVRVVNESAGTASYTAAAESVDRALALAVNPASGTVPAGGWGEITVRPAAGLAAGVYGGFVRVRMQTADGPRETAVAVTVHVQAEADSKAGFGVDRVGAAAFPLPGGGYETVPLTVTNNTGTAKTYTARADEGIQVDAPTFALGAGESRTMQVSVTGPIPGGQAARRCVTFTRPDGSTYRWCFLVMRPGALSGACRATGLEPVITRLEPAVARPGFPVTATVQVFDSCGEPLEDFTATMSLHNGPAESKLIAVTGSGKAVDKPGGNGGSFARPGRGEAVTAGGSVGRALVAELAAETEITGTLYPCFQPVAAGMTLRVSVEAPNGAGGEPLTGMTEILLPVETAAGTALVAGGALVGNSNFEPVPLAPYELFSLFTVLPGRTPVLAEQLPLPVELGGVKVLIDGKEVPLLRVAGEQVQGILPDLAAGEHIANVIHNGTMAGALSFWTGAANPSPIMQDYVGRVAHIYDGAGRLVTQENPLQAGEVYTMYGTGLGKMRGVTLTAGAAAPVVAMAAEQACTVRAGENEATILYCGRSPGSLVLDQVNFRFDSLAAAEMAVGETAPMVFSLHQTGNSGTSLAGVWGKTTKVLSDITFAVSSNFADAKFLVDGKTITGNTGIMNMASGTALELDIPADPQVPAPDTRYEFYGWSHGGARKQTLTPTMSGGTAAYFLASYKLTVVGTATVQPPANYNGGVASPDGYYKQTASSFIPVTVTGSCPAGAAPTGLLVSTAAGSVVLPNPAVITMNRPTTVTVQCPPPSPLAACTPAPAGMVGWFPLDETSGTVAGNLGSLGVPGTVIGSTTPVAGRVAGARNFSGGGYEEVNDPNAFNVGTGDFSIDAWVRGTGAAFGNGTHFIAGKQWPQSGVANGYLLAVNQGRLRFHMSDGTVAVNASGGPVLADGQWHHVAVTVGRGKDAGTLYVDGVKVSAFDASIAPNSLTSTNRFRIGKLQQQDPIPGTAFAGVIDEVEIFNRAVTADEIARIFAAGAFGKCKGVTPPVVHSVTLAGCGLTATSSVNAVSTNPLSYPAGTQVVLRANPAGQTFNGIKVTMGGVTTNYTVNPVSVALNGNAVVTADCGCIESPQRASLTTWYPLNEKSMPVRDIAGTETAANPTGTPQFTAGKIGGGGIAISGVSWLDAANAAEGDIGTGNFSIDLWVKTSVATGTQTFLDKRVNRNVPQTRGYSFYLFNGRLSFQMADGSGDTSTAICGPTANASCTNFESPASTVNVADGNWHLVAVTVNRTGGATGGKLYVDGIVVHTFNPAVRAGSLSNSTPLRMGNHGNASPSVGSGFSGEIDEVEIFTAELTGAEVMALYAAEVSGKCRPVTGPGPGVCLDPLELPGMVGWYTMDETAGPLLADKTVNPAPITTIPASQPAGGKVAGGWMVLNGLMATSGSPAKYNFGTGDFSLDGWIRFTGGQQLVPLILKMSGTAPQTGFALYTDGGVLRLDLGTGSGANTIWRGTKNLMLDRIWHHFVVSVSRTGGVRFYVDGAVDALTQNPAVPAGSLSNNEPLQIGGVELILDEVELFNQALTINHAQKLFLADANGKCKADVVCPPGSVPPPPGMTAWYTMNQTSTPFKDTAPGVQSDAIWVQPASILSIPGKVGNAARFLPVSPVGFGAYAEAANSSEGDLSGNQISIDAWVRSPDPTNLNTTVGIVEKIAYQGVPASSPGVGYIMFLNQGWLHFTIFDGTTQHARGLSSPSSKVPPNTWAHVAVTLDRTTNEVKFYLNGVLEGTQSFAGVNVPLTNSAKLKIGYAPGLFLATPNAYDLDEIEIFDRVLSASEIKRIYDAGSAGKCGAPAPSTDVDVTVRTAVNGVVTNAGLQFSVNGTTRTNTHTYTAPGGSTQVHSTQSQIANGIYYNFTGWTPGTTAGTQTVTLPASGTADYVANFSPIGVVVTLVNPPGCSVTVGPSSLSVIPPPPVVMSSAAPFMVLPGTGSATGFTLSVGGGPVQTFTSLPQTIGPFTAPVTITATCGPPVSDVNVTVRTAVNGTVTNAGLQITVDGFNYTDSRSYTAPGGSTHTHSTLSQVAGGYYYTFNGWTPGTTAGTQQVTLPASGTADYVANFTRSGIVVTVNNTAQCAVGVAPASLYMIPPPPIVMPIGIPFFVTPGAGAPSGFTISVGGAAPVNYANYQIPVGPFSAPITITPQCSTTVTHTVSTEPPGLQVTIACDGAAGGELGGRNGAYAGSSFAAIECSRGQAVHAAELDTGGANNRERAGCADDVYGEFQYGVQSNVNADRLYEYEHGRNSR